MDIPWKNIVISVSYCPCFNFLLVHIWPNLKKINGIDSKTDYYELVGLIKFELFKVHVRFVFAILVWSHFVYNISTNSNDLLLNLHVSISNFTLCSNVQSIGDRLKKYPGKLEWAKHFTLSKDKEDGVSEWSHVTIVLMLPLSNHRYCVTCDWRRQLKTESFL
jgi:hypothetical protein